MSSGIELRDVVKSFGQGGDAVAAVNSVNLDVEHGQFLTLLGASGCGKTTTLRLIAGFESPTSGEIRFQGRNVTDVPVTHRDMRMVFQDYALFPNMNVFDNVAFGLRVSRARRRYSSTEVSRRVREYLDLVQLSEQPTRMPHQLSGGQRQRVALARALITDPSVVLFDEPLGSLDAKLRKAMQVELKRIHKELGKTFIYVTHDQEEALGMSDRIAVMNAGRVRQYGSPEEVYREPNCRFVASFIGAANVLEAKVESGNGNEAQIRLKNDWVGKVPATTPVRSGENVGLMIRAETARLRRENSASGADGVITVRATVAERLFLGDRIEYHVELTGQGGDLRIHIPATEAEEFDVGDSVDVDIRPEDTRILAD